MGSREPQLGGSGSAWFGVDSWDPELLLSRGEALLAKGDAKGAGAAARRIIQLDPYSARGSLLLAYALIAQDRGAEAKVVADRAVRLEPAEATAHEALAAAWLAERRSVEAEAAARRSIALDSGSATAHYLLALALELRNAKADAQREYQIAVDLDPDLDAAAESEWLSWRAPLLGALSAASFIAVHALSGLFNRLTDRFVALLLLIVTATFVAAVLIGRLRQERRLAHLGPYGRTIVTLQARRRQGQALRQVLAPLALITAAIVSLSALTFVFAVSDRPSFDLRVGDCFTTDKMVAMDHVSAIPCTIPHDVEVFAELLDPTPSDAPYPGLDALHADATLRCKAIYPSYVGVPYDSNAPAGIRTFVPEDVYWAINIRMRWCGLADWHGHQLVGSLRKNP